MASCVVVIEGTKKSGSLITARYAADQGREVFAVPGPATSPYSEGPNELVKNGAYVATTGYEILDVLHISRHEPHAPQTDDCATEIERKILSFLRERGPHPIDDIAHALSLPASGLLADLSILELRGSIRDHGGKVYGIV